MDNPKDEAPGVAAPQGFGVENENTQPQQDIQSVTINQDFRPSVAGDLVPVGVLTDRVVNDLDETRFTRHAHHLSGLGGRAVDAFLRELAADRMLWVAIDRQLSRYAQLDRSTLDLLGVL